MSSSDDDRPVLRAGRTAWAVVGIIVVGLIAWTALAAVSGLVIPLVVATVIGVLLHPLVDRMAGWGVPRAVGAVLVLLGLGAILVGAVWLTVVGVIDQGSEIAAKITAAFGVLEDQFASLDLASVDLDETSLGDGVTQMLGGLAGFFGSAFSSVAAFLAGTLVAVFFLYFLLVDWARFESWVATKSAVGRTSGEAVVEESVTTLRRYFGALTTTSALTAVIIGIGAAVLDVPLVMAIALVTFVTSYIPYLGAIFSGAFAVLIALGSQGTTAAIVLLVIILVAQNVVQTLLLTKLTSDRLRLHPIVSLGSTIVGAAVAGVLGAMLSAPVTVIVLDLVAHLRGRPTRAASEALDELPGDGGRPSDEPPGNIVAEP
ncbi:putative PurR-regulated permease PerM [Sediminihabitans luteus]|uniref:Putative PurR-regulated permease PerM n=1 Tax=Sediminihabitans luteus TaxID=1138585 RepID=A0A2M9CCW5_9CELL|nr:AI-2E family transporter [Sediminihabitans luteus]PJJ69204.1 putative PurR-regulated permease PerM [Sediminihabitans luteus]GII98879.1 AI-2E family transporter [Sediminihabitans luteus]